MDPRKDLQLEKVIKLTEEEIESFKELSILGKKLEHLKAELFKRVEETYDVLGKKLGYIQENGTIEVYGDPIASRTESIVKEAVAKDQASMRTRVPIDTAVTRRSDTFLDYMKRFTRKMR